MTDEDDKKRRTPFHNEGARNPKETPSYTLIHSPTGTKATATEPPAAKVDPINLDAATSATIVGRTRFE
ncbi:hypothetical protein CPLU01_12988 [Colletotrichum plurivorum]|uniref:Uncharacterized protein n=1 Tax=Colletotrichum plurivorum TaxID=2175906 RepID=A0A8H6JUV4_9PEZI|nr:hypothetical protein CPLU01_12988 [Colletotrichum plurivorum]